jgi:hypothetical protein
MLTKKKIAESIILRASGGRLSTTNAIDERDVYVTMDMVAAQMIAEDLRLQMRDKGRYNIDAAWVRQFTNVPLQYDKKTDQCYVDLPSNRINLEDDYDIQFIGWMQGGKSWPQESQGSQEAWELLEAGFVDQAYPYYLIGNQARFRTMPKRYQGQKLLVRMVAGIDGYDEEDVLPIPGIFAQRLLEETARTFMVQITTKAKFINDSNTNVKA